MPAFDTGDKIWALFEELSRAKALSTRLETKLDAIHDQLTEFIRENRKLEHRVVRLEKILWVVVGLTPAIGGGAAKVMAGMGYL